MIKMDKDMAQVAARGLCLHDGVVPKKPKDEDFSHSEMTAVLPSDELQIIVPAGKEGRSAFLIVQSGGMVGRQFRIEKARTVIGRSDTNEVVLREDGVSRRHATVEKAAAGLVLVDGEPAGNGEYKRSTNGVYVNGERITRHLLQDGDRIQLGPSGAVLKFAFLDEIDVQAGQEMFDKATRDGLTGAFKKEYFAEQLRIDFAFSSRKKQNLSLVLLDIDHFKKLNDTWGHPAGDFALKTLATLISDALREEDVFARYGGEEFAILLRDTNGDRAFLIAERIRRIIEGHQFLVEGKRLPVTISMGVSSLFDKDGNQLHDSPRTLLKAADELLYVAKRGGRNRVESAATAH
jgi:diguanylate cyclase (GGDEF)-like protein